MITDLPDIWRRALPELRTHLDALVLVAFRLLFHRLEEDDFFPGLPGSVDAVRREAQDPPELLTLLRTRDPSHAPAFAELVDSRLLSFPDSPAVASLAFAIDRVLGGDLSKNLQNGDPAHLRSTAEAVNVANRVLRLHRLHAIVLVRRPRFWSDYPNVVSTVPPHDPPSTFLHLVPLTTKLSCVNYSSICGSDPRRIVVALLPAEAPSWSSPALRISKPANGVSQFRFKHWTDLPTEIRDQHHSFAGRIADYITSADDALGTIYVVAAPELTLAPEAHRTIDEAVATRRNAAWIVFPGSYHIERGNHVVNRAVMCVGGMIDKSDLLADSECSAVSAVKGTPFVHDYQGLKCVEDIDRTASSVHVLDSDIGRIAVMICRDFLEDELRGEVLSMGIDHLFVLSMSPDSGAKFKIAMDSASNCLTGTFLVNAFTKCNAKFVCAGHRKPLIREEVDLKSPMDKPYCVVL